MIGNEIADLTKQREPMLRWLLFLAFCFHNRALWHGAKQKPTLFLPKTPSASGMAVRQIRVVPASDPLLTKAAGRGDTVGRLLKAAKPTIGVRYKWGGTRMDEGIDCSNYTWLLYRSLGMGYDRFFRSEERRVGKECRSRWSP